MVGLWQSKKDRISTSYTCKIILYFNKYPIFPFYLCWIPRRKPYNAIARQWAEKRWRSEKYGQANWFVPHGRIRLQHPHFLAKNQINFSVAVSRAQLVSSPRTAFGEKEILPTCTSFWLGNLLFEFEFSFSSISCWLCCIKRATACAQPNP